MEKPNSSEVTTVSTFERLMEDPERKKQFDKGYKEFLLSELVLELIEDADK